MEQVTPTARDLAILVISDEQSDESGSLEPLSAAQRTFDKLNAHLSLRLGSRGYHALLKRAVTLAVTGFPALSSVHVTDDGTIDGLQHMTQSGAITEGSVAIVARLIELLDTFIGRTLTVRILHNVWPNAIRLATGDQRGESNG